MEIEELQKLKIEKSKQAENIKSNIRFWDNEFENATADKLKEQFKDDGLVAVEFNGGIDRNSILLCLKFSSNGCLEDRTAEYSSLCSVNDEIFVINQNIKMLKLEKAKSMVGEIKKGMEFKVVNDFKIELLYACKGDVLKIEKSGEFYTTLSKLRFNKSDSFSLNFDERVNTDELLIHIADGDLIKLAVQK